MRLCLDGLYPCPEMVQSILAPTPGTTKRILDLGCGAGNWSIDMAEKFPHVEVLGTDRPPVGKVWNYDIPPNCHLQEYPSFDFLCGFQNTFDLIHMRFVAGSCEQFLKTMYDVQACLKPGGMFILIDSTGTILKEDRRTLTGVKHRHYPNGSRLQRMLYEIRHANQQLGCDEFMMRATLQDGLWEIGEYEDCGAAELLVPIGSWASSPHDEDTLRQKEIGRLMAQCIRSFEPMNEMQLKLLGFQEGTMQQWSRDIHNELSDESLHTFLDVRILWGRKPDGSPRSMLLEAQDHEEYISDWKRYLNVHYAQESWKKVTDRRQKPATYTAKPIPFVDRHPMLPYSVIQRGERKRERRH